MEFLINSAWAAPAGQQPSMIQTLLPLVIIFAVFYFLLIRPQTKRAKEHRAMVSALNTGDEVVTGGGILGRITQVDEQFVTLEVAGGVELKVQRHTIQTMMPKGTYKQEPQRKGASKKEQAHKGADKKAS